MNNYTTANDYKGPRLFGAPVGDFGIFQTALFIFASTLSSFFIATFVGIVALLAYTSIGHHTADFSMAYMRVGLPIGILMFLFSTVYLGGIYIRRITRR
ncbi:hypothetical protein [Terriglobus saanensis]|uniref:Uncharacterized protein n=1 Tax=Terriglobus saanensis (strain ATCC BAA-1853 / DSM 23119 / SP1PR4) TaxID=401053 RepID=E8V682_TERSS|nr:hypothetical protein [Terriglobus saanensis]ADV84973.1 hypothetical protein AciPR4_4229 [Terriglobus saanensis SP1PR4]